MSPLTVAGLLSLALFATIIADDNLTSKFTRFQCLVHDNVLIKDGSCGIKAISRNTTIINLSGFFTRQVNDILLHIILYKKLNVYKPFLVDVWEDFCQLFSKKASLPYTKILTNIALPYMNLNHSCPYSGLIRIKNLPMDARKLKDLWPDGEYRLDIIGFLNKNASAAITIRLHLEFKEKKTFG